MADIDIEVSVSPDRHMMQIAITQGDRVRRETRMVFLADEIDVLIAALIAKRADMLPHQKLAQHRGRSDTSETVT